MKIKNILSKTFVLSLLIGISCTSNQEETTSTPNIAQEPIEDLLPSWNEGATKGSILDFVSEVTNPESEYFVPVEDRIAVFDNDGNLWSEQPVYFQFFYALDKVNEMADEHPEWQDQQPFKAAIEGDIEEVAHHGVEGLLKIVMATHTGNTVDEFEASVNQWLDTAKHARFDRPYTDLVYQPMLELIDYLKAADFKVFIVSGGGIDFMRTWVEEVYGIPNDQVIGSSIKTEFVLVDGKPEIRRLPQIDFIDDKEDKPIGIQRHIGRKPIFCSGNSDGDLAMMQWTASGEGKRFMLYLHHTDSTREWAYDRDSHVGRLDKGLNIAKAEGWAVTDMQRDWKVVYPFELAE